MKIDRPSRRRTIPRLLAGVMVFGFVLMVALPATAQKREAKDSKTPKVLNTSRNWSSNALQKKTHDAKKTKAPGSDVGSYGEPYPSNYTPYRPQAGNRYESSYDTHRVEVPKDGYAPYPNTTSRARQTPWDAASVPREVVLEWAMTSTPSRDDLPELEALLEKAFETHPQVVEAQAQLQQAQAAVERARMQVAREIVHTRAQWEVRRRAVQCLSDALKEKPDDEKLLQQYVNARAKLAQIEMELPFIGLQWRRQQPGPYRSPPEMTGMAPPRVGVQCKDGQVTAVEVPIQGPLPVPAAVNPEIRNALLKKVDVRFEETPLEKVVAHLEKEVGIPFVLQQFDGIENCDVTLNLKSVTLAAACQALEDSMPNLCFVVRPYGILVTTRQFAHMLPESHALRTVGPQTSGPMFEGNPMRVYAPCDIPTGPVLPPVAAPPRERPSDEAQPTWASPPKKTAPPKRKSKR